jgi:hypothetical protein
MICLFRYAPSEFEGVTENDLDQWKNKHGDFCSGCIEGAMKEHAKYKSTKLLVSTVPGQVNVGDNQNIKKPLYVQVDVCTKYVTGVVMNSQKKVDCTTAIIAVQTDYNIKGRSASGVCFERTWGRVVIEGGGAKSGISRG